MRIEIEPGVRLFVDVVGAGLEPTPAAMVAKPTMLLLHGGPGFDHSGFRPFFDRFADTHQVVLYDHRGNGRSDGWDAPSDWNLDRWADDVVALCDALGIDRPIVLGQSFGGFVAQRYAARHPEHPSAVVLSSTGSRVHGEESAARFRALGGPEAEASYRRVFLRGDASSEAFLEYLMTAMPHYNSTASSNEPGQPIMNFDVMVDFTVWFPEMDLRPDVRAITAPTLVLAGSEDPMMPLSCAQEIADLLAPGLRHIEIVDGAGHGTYRDRPEATEAILRDFLASDEVMARVP
ncbi:MAG TPA: alpha/beta hydrolase [Microthrixaceae bacterium]|jgi:proline iminopeptidase|nr:alpha/beta hydrolase [Microthrixaceae bacterium]